MQRNTFFYSPVLARAARDQGAAPLWRLEAEHVPTGERIYFKSFDELERFLAPYLPGINEIQ